MADPIAFATRISAAVPADLADAARTAAEARGLTVADYVRGAVQARLMLDGARFVRLPNLQRHAASARRGRSL